MGKLGRAWVSAWVPGGDVVEGGGYSPCFLGEYRHVIVLG